jgi:2-polyprenyl-6-methoxyphenol hydroxylase-like FAD-dependent oxidoreductase
MAKILGRQAVIVGAGIGGLTAARVLADHFERVLILERDALPVEPEDRPSIPQGRHVHGLLRGGQNALEELLPGFERDLAAGGAVAVRSGLDVRVERPGFDPFPQRDLGVTSYAMSRPLLELTVRRLVQMHDRIEIRQRCRVLSLGASDDAVTGVQYADSSSTVNTLTADLVVDASGRGTLTLDTLKSMGHALAEETEIGVDLNYATAVYDIPDDAPGDWLGLFVFPSVRGSGGALLLPLEGKRWIITVGARHDEKAPADEVGFLTFAQRLRRPTLHNAIEHAKLHGRILRYGFPESLFRHYERLPDFPRGLLPIGDAICRFNPVHGQGMSVAAMEACALRRVLAQRSAETDPLAGLAPAFFTEAAAIIEAPWAMAAIPDFLHPRTRGERPPNFEQRIKFALALTKLAARDPAIHKLNAEVSHLLKPLSVYQDPELVQRVMAVMAE